MGSRHEAPETRGFFHFIEHMLFKGTSRHDSYTLLKLLEASGGFINGFTDRDSTCISFTVPSFDWLAVTELALEMLFDSTFPPEEFEKEKRVILSEILQVEDDVEETAFDAYLARFWQGDPAALSIAGSASEVEAIDRDRLFDFYKRHFRPCNALLVATGEFDEDHLSERVDAVVGSREAGIEAAGLLTVSEPRAGTFSSWLKGDSTQVHYFDGFHLPGAGNARELADLSVISNVLGEASTSRLFQRIREKMGYAYTIQSTIAASRTESLLLVQAIADKKLTRRCVEAIDEELTLLLAKGLSESEISEAARRISGSFILSLEDPEFRNRRLARWQLSGFSIPSVDEELSWLSSCDISSIGARLVSLSYSPRGRFAYGDVNSRLATALGFQEG